MEGEDVRMLEVGRRLDLGQEPLGTDHRRELRAQHFDRYLAIVLDVVGEIYRRHTAGAEFALNCVAIRESGREPFVRI